MTSYKLPAALVILGAVVVAAIMVIPAAPVTQGTQCISYEDENFETELNEYIVPFVNTTYCKAIQSGADQTATPQVKRVAVVLDGTVIGTFNMTKRAYMPMAEGEYAKITDYKLVVLDQPVYEDGKVILVGEQLRLELRDSSTLVKSVITTSAAEERILQTVEENYDLLFTYNGETVYVAKDYGHYKLDMHHVDIIQSNPELQAEDLAFQKFFDWASDNNAIISGLLEDYDGIIFHNCHVF